MKGRVAALLLAGALQAAGAASSEERVDLALPESLPFRVTDLASGAAPVTATLSFRHILLLPGRRLRVSVRTEEREGGGAAPEISFTTKRARGGSGFRGRLRSGDYTPVFESAPLAAWGDVEIVWRLESAGRVERAGPRAVTLRWKVESVPVPGWPAPAERAGGEGRLGVPGGGGAESPGAGPPGRHPPARSPEVRPRPPVPL